VGHMDTWPSLKTLKQDHISHIFIHILCFIRNISSNILPVDNPTQNNRIKTFLSDLVMTALIYLQDGRCDETADSGYV